jgi:hypothetical protein
MFIELRKGITLRQGTFTAVIAPEQVILSALNTAPDLERFLFLYVCGSSSRLLSRMHRTSPDFGVHRPFTADQLLTVLKGAGHTVVFIEHDPALFKNAGHLLLPVAAALRRIGDTSLLILYAPVMDPAFAALSRPADRTIEILHTAETPESRRFPAAVSRHPAGRRAAQQTLGVL